MGDTVATDTCRFHSIGVQFCKQRATLFWGIEGFSACTSLDVDAPGRCWCLLGRHTLELSLSGALALMLCLGMMTQRVIDASLKTIKENGDVGSVVRLGMRDLELGTRLIS